MHQHAWGKLIQRSRVPQADGREIKGERDYQGRMPFCSDESLETP